MARSMASLSTTATRNRAGRVFGTAVCGGRFSSVQMHRGSRTVKVLPAPGRLRTVISPFNSFTSASVMESPKPKPSSASALPSRAKGSNIRPVCSSVIPAPVSSMRRVTKPSV